MLILTSITIAVLVVGLFIVGTMAMLKVTASPGEMLKQVALGVAIWLLLPPVVWYGVGLYTPPPDWKNYFVTETKTMPTPPKVHGEAAAQQGESADDAFFYETLFWVAYPIGLLAVVIGTWFRVPPVGVGLLLGGLWTVSLAWIVYWDKMEVWLKFASLVTALVVTVGLGLWKYRPRSSPDLSGGPTRITTG